MRFRNGYLGALFLVAWSCVAFVAVWLVRTRATDSSLALAAAALLLASLAVSRYVLGLSFTSAPVLYLSLLGLFHLGTVVPWALGIYDVSRVPWFVPYGLSRALALITYSIVVYQVGLLAGLQRLRYHENPVLLDSHLHLRDSKIFMAGNVLLLAGAIMFVTGLIRLDPVGYYRLIYSETFRLRAESDPRFFGTGITIALIGLCLLVAGASRRQMRITYAYTGVWFSMLFYLGFRSPAITAALLVYAVSQKKAVGRSRWVPGAAVLFLLVAVPIVTIIREEPLEQRSLRASFHEINILDGPAEVGEAIRPLVNTIDLVRPGNYRHERTYLVAIKGILPNLALRWEAPATESTDDLPPNRWITSIVSPWSYRNYQGMGFSAIAESYMNFGIIGVMCFFFLLAFLLVRIEGASLRSSYGLATWALILGPLLWAARNDSTQFFRPATWGLLCLGAVGLYSGRFSSTVSMGRRVEVKRRPKALGELQS